MRLRYSVAIPTGLWCLLLCWVALGQSPIAKDVVRLQREADWHFKQGSYDRARRLYQVCLSYPYLSDKSLIQQKQDKTRRMIQLDNAATEALRRGDRVTALSLTKQMLQINPADPYAKATLNDLQVSNNARFSLQDSRLIAQANAFYEKGDWEGASRIYALIDKLPNGKPHPELAARKEAALELAQFEREALTYRQARDWKNVARVRTQAQVKYAKEAGKSRVLQSPPSGPDSPFPIVCSVALQKAMGEMANCSFYKAEATLVTTRKVHIECQNDARLTRKLVVLKAIATNYAIVNSSRIEVSKRPVVTQAYNQLLKLTPNCVRESYFNYVHDQAVVNKNNGNCAQAIILFEEAKRISASLAKQYRVDKEIQVQIDTCKCRDRGKVLLSELQRADRLYRSCECDSAIMAWKSAEYYLCSTNLTGKAAWEAWQEKATDCQKNSATTKRFTALVAQAEEFFAADLCKEAQQRYKSADSLGVRCGTLNKGGIKSALAKCEQCVQKQQYDSSMTKAERSRLADFKKDALRYYREALTYNPPADQLPKLNEIITQLECEEENKNCPPLPPPPPPVVKHLTKLSLIGGSNRLFPEIVSTLYPIKNATGWYEYTGGIRFDHSSLEIPISFCANALYTSVLIYGLNNDKRYADETFKIGYAEINAAIKLHSPKKNEGQPRLYLHGGFSLLLPVKYQYRNSVLNLEDRQVNSLTGTVKVPKGGLGIEWQKPGFGLSIEGYYGSFRGDLFNIDPLRQNINTRGFTSPVNRIIGINSTFRFW